MVKLESSFRRIFLLPHIVALVLLHKKSLLASSSINLFSLENYSQNVSDYIDPNSEGYDGPLISEEYQRRMFNSFLSHYCSISPDAPSPWAEAYVTRMVLHGQAGDVRLNCLRTLSDLASESKTEAPPVGRYCRPYADDWYEVIALNMNISEDLDFIFKSENRAIAVRNAHIRKLPTSDPVYYAKFVPIYGTLRDDLQCDVVKVGEPLYVLQFSRDKAWALVVTADYSGWVEANAFAMVSAKFVKNWVKAARRGLAAIVKQGHFFSAKGFYQDLAIVGATLPIEKIHNEDYLLLYPIRGQNGQAILERVLVKKDVAVVMPHKLTPRNFAQLIKFQVGKVYCWRGEVQFGFDCTSLLKALFVPFGIYLPRDSSQQAAMQARVDVLDDLSAAAREEFLIKNGKPLLTLIYSPGHIMLYLGHIAIGNSQDGSLRLAATTLQSISTIRLKSAREQNLEHRSIFGSTVLLPLLHSYPEEGDLTGFYDQTFRKNFRLIHLDENCLIEIVASAFYCLI